MKKVMFVVVLLLVASTCFAQLQSGPSNTAGYVKITGVAGSYTAFGLPFKFWDVPSGGIPTYGVVSTNPSDIFGDQTNCGGTTTADRILRQDNGTSAFRSTTLGCGWTGTLESGSGVLPGRAYWYYNRTAANRDLVLAGEVDNTGNYATIAMALATYNPYSWRDSRAVDRDDLNLVAAGFRGGSLASTSDQVINQTGGAFFWRRTTDNTWQPTTGPLSVQPGAAYWIFNRNQAGDVVWNYNYDASGATLSRGDSPKGDVGTPISKVPSTPVVKSGSKEARN